MSIRDRIRQIQASSESWRQRPHSFYGKESEPIPQVSQIRESLLISQETWKSRVEEKDNAEFTVKARLRQDDSRCLQRSLTIHTTDFPSKHSTTPERIRNATNKKLPISPINRATSKENRPTVKPIVQPQVPNVVPETVKQTVSVRPVDDEKFSHFFTTPTPLYESNAPVETTTSFPDLSTPATNGVLASDHNIVAQHRRAVRPERRKPQTIQSLAQLSTKPMEYEEIRPSAASNRTVPSVQRLLAPVNPSNRIAQEADERQARLAEAVLVGLGSREDFSGVKSNLRQLSDDLPLSQFQRQLLPYKSTMLLQIKGRRHVQVRLVCPSADSLNSGDCFLLVTTDAVYVWLGAFANVVEINKARELAVWVHKHRDLGYRGNQPEPIIIRENPKQVMENGHGRVQSSTSQFWNAMGYDQPQGIPASGTADEDELYESMIQCSNRVYEVTSEQLVPCESCWGSPLQYSLLSSAKAFVFDFGSEVYLWTGAQISPEIRLAGMELVQQVHAAPYDYTCCGMNPLNPLMTHSDIPPSDTSRPRWTLVGRVTEKGETVLFKEKFIDWPDAARIGIELKVKSCQTKSGSAYSSIPPYPADELYQAAFNDPAPEPVLLTLDGRFVGRGGEGCRYEDGIPRRYRVETGQVQMWHVSEFSRSELPAVSHGQFFTEDTYVIRWPFRVMNVGMREVPSRAAEPKVNNEQCAYFFWQGSHSRVAEKGAAALMTVELDEERGPQLRVPEGQEPPAFCRLFNGRMIIHLGRRDSASAVHPHARMFFVHGEVPAEGHLIEVPPDVSSLRPQGAFLILQYHSSDYIESPVSVQRAWLWSGRLCPEANLTTAQYVVEQLKACCPPELAADLAVVNETHQTEADFGPSELLSLLNIEDYPSGQLCALVDCGLNALTLWQLGLASSSQLSARRITYPLQPDATLLGATPVQSQVQSGQTSPMDMAKALAERLRASSEAAFAMRQSNSQNRLAFPFSLRDLYEVPQPAFFLLVVGTRCVYVWQGWWRVRSSSRKSRRSPVFRRLSKSMMQHDEISLDDKPIDGDDDDESLTASDSEHSITGTAKGRFSALRRAVLRTAQELGKRIECEASVVYAGIEPPEFLSLFPPYERDAGAALYHQREEGKSDHQTDPVDDLLTSIESVRYTLAELQQRPLPDDLDATNLEKYLDDEAFESAFSMSREDFDQLPAWKKLDLKKRLNLF